MHKSNLGSGRATPFLAKKFLKYSGPPPPPPPIAPHLIGDRLDEKEVKLKKLLRSRVIVNRMKLIQTGLQKLLLPFFLAKISRVKKNSASSYYSTRYCCYVLFYRSDIIFTSFTIITIIGVVLHHCWPPVYRQQVQLNCQ